jgi:hypothetical protein
MRPLERSEHASTAPPNPNMPAKPARRPTERDGQRHGKIPMENAIGAVRGLKRVLALCRHQPAPAVRLIGLAVGRVCTVAHMLVIIRLVDKAPIESPHP